MQHAKADVIVLGAGMVGVSAALHLQARGRDVVLVDRHQAAGRETSFGNAGLIERSSVFPYMFPRELRSILRYAFQRSPEAHYHLRALPQVAPWLARYFAHSTEQGLMRSARALLPLIERCVIEHEALMEQAGSANLFSKTGWLKLFRSETTMRKGLADVERIRAYDLKADILDQAAIRALEPHLMGEFVGAALWRDTGAVSDPGELAASYARLFTGRGGRFLAGDATTLSDAAGGWTVSTDEGPVAAAAAVVALGPWSDDVFRRLGYRIPLGIKRGYHRHFRAHGNAFLNHPVFDADGAYVLAPMARGIRMTTGAEFAKRDAAPTPRQVAHAEIAARKLFPLAESLDERPWMGRRPCLPDMLPMVGPAKRHRGLWFDFGHQHLGLTLGPVTGRVLAEQMTGETPFTDPAPYATDRFG